MESTRSIEPVPRTQVKQFEEQCIALPDLYIRKYQLCEKLAQTKKHYVPKVNVFNQTNQEIRRPLGDWGKVMNEMQIKAQDLLQRRKWKIAKYFHLAKEAFVTHQRREKNREIVQHFSVCVSHHLSQIVNEAFRQEIDEKKPIFSYLNRVRKINHFEDADSINYHYLESTQKVKDFLSSNREAYAQFEYLFPEQPTFSETQPIESKPPSKQTQKLAFEPHFEFDFKKKYDNLNDVLQLFYLRDVPLKEQFEKSFSSVENFPTFLEQVERIRNQVYIQEPCLDPEYEDLLYQAGCIPEQVLSDGERMMKRMKLFNPFPVTEGPLPNEMDTRELFRYKYNYIERECYFAQVNGKWVPKDEPKFLSHPQNISKQNALLQHYFIYYLQKFNGDFNQISAALQSNLATASLFYYTPSFCAELYAWFTLKKAIPSNSKFLIPHQYQRQTYNKVYKFKEATEEHEKIVNNYEKLLFEPAKPALKQKLFYATNAIQPPTLKVNFISEEFQKPQFLELAKKIKVQKQMPQEPQQITIDYSTVDKLLLKSLEESVKKAQTQNGYYEKRYRSILEIQRQDTLLIDFLKKEMLKRNKTRIHPSTLVQSKPPQLMHPSPMGQQVVPQGPPPIPNPQQQSLYNLPPPPVQNVAAQLPPPAMIKEQVTNTVPTAQKSDKKKQQSEVSVQAQATRTQQPVPIPQPPQAQPAPAAKTTSKRGKQPVEAQSTQAEEAPSQVASQPGQRGGKRAKKNQKKQDKLEEDKNDEQG